MRHPLTSLILADIISGLSTMERFKSQRIAASRWLGNFAMSEDIFFEQAERHNYPGSSKLQDGYRIGQLPGSHDELLLDPDYMLYRAKQQFELTPSR